MKVSVVAITLNEEDMLPHFLNYYSEVADFIHIWDNESTDNTKEIALSCPKVIWHTWSSNNQTNDAVMLKVKNEEYKRLDSDFNIVVDCDEFLWHANGLRNYLTYCLNSHINLPKITGFDMVDKEFPIYPKNILDIKTGLRSKNFDKRAIIGRGIDINYFYGCHVAHPRGTIIEGESEIKLLHYKYLGYQHTLDRLLFIKNRMSKYNLDNGLATHCQDISWFNQEYWNNVNKDKKIIV